MFSCPVCRGCLTVTSSCAPEAALTNAKTRGGLTHPNYKLFTLLKAAEGYFSKHADDPEVFWDTIEHVVDKNITFPCPEHKTDAVARILRYYIMMRMRQYCKGKARNTQKESGKKKKEARLCKK